jgi:UPF0176 protein
MSGFDVEAFYKFVPLADCKGTRSQILRLCETNGIRGTILLAEEGINGTISGIPSAMKEAMAGIRAMPEFMDLKSTLSRAKALPFKRMKVRVKREIVTMGIADVDPSRKVGQYVAPQEWNALISDPDVIVIDTRNSFEFEMGHFKGAIDPKTSRFSEFPQFVKTALGQAKGRKIAMFCTGGIRCEKATSYMIAEGFTSVYHLQGGILRYLDEMPADQSLWQGQCFVFDERETLGPGLSAGRTGGTNEEQ